MQRPRIDLTSSVRTPYPGHRKAGPKVVSNQETAYPLRVLPSALSLTGSHMKPDSAPTTYQGIPIVVLPPWLYEAAERAGYDMRAFVREQRCEQISSLLHRTT